MVFLGLLFILLAGALGQSPTHVSVMPGDSFLDVSWNVSTSLTEALVRSFSVYATPMDSNFRYTQADYMNAAGTQSYDFSTTSQIVMFNASVGRCPNILSTYQTAACYTAAPTVAETFSISDGKLRINVGFRHTYSAQTGTPSIANQFLWNGLPRLEFVPRKLDVDSMFIGKFGFASNNLSPSGLAYNGFCVFDYVNGSPRCSVYLIYAAANMGETAYIRVRYLTATSSSYSLLSTVSFTSTGEDVELAVERDAANSVIRLYYRRPGLSWTYIAGRDTSDGFHTTYPFDVNNAFIAIVAGNDHTTLNRVATVDELTVLTTRDAITKFLSFSNNWDSLEGTNQMCHLAGPVSATGLHFQPGKPQYTFRLPTQNGVGYRVAVHAVSPSGVSTGLTAPGVHTPVPNFPTLSDPNAKPLLFLDNIGKTSGTVTVLYDASGNKRHFTQFNRLRAATSLTQSSTNRAGGLSFTTTVNNMVDYEILNRNMSSGLDLVDNPYGFTHFNLFVPVYSTVYLRSHVLLNMDAPNYINSYATTGYTASARPFNDTPGWNFNALEASYFSSTSATRIPAKVAFRVVTSRASTSTSSNPLYYGAGISYGLNVGSSTTGTHPDYSNQALYTTAYFPVPAGGYALGSESFAAGKWIVDGCRGAQNREDTDLCWAPSLTPNSFHSIPQYATTYPRWEPHARAATFSSTTYNNPPYYDITDNYDPFENATEPAAQVHQRSLGYLRLSDSNAYGTGTYQRRTFMGTFIGTAIYSTGLTNPDDRKKVQDFISDRWGGYCRIPTYPHVTVTPTSGRTACAAGKSVNPGDSCTFTCDSTSVKLGGTTVSTGAITCTAGSGFFSKATWCGQQCPKIAAPNNALDCSKYFMKYSFKNEADPSTHTIGVGSKLFDTIELDLMPVYVHADIDSIFKITKNGLVGVKPYPVTGSACTKPEPHFLAPNRPTWATTPVTSIVRSGMTVLLDNVNATAGLGFYLSSSGSTIDGFMVSFTAGSSTFKVHTFSSSPGTFTEYTSLGIATLAVQPQIAYKIEVESFQNIHRVYVNDTLMTEFTSTYNAFGFAAPFVIHGMATFSDLYVRSSCNPDNSCDTTTGQSCQYTCKAGYTPLASTSQHCGYDGLIGAAVVCAPPLPRGPASVQQMRVPENAELGHIVGVINVTVDAPTDIERAVLFEIIDGNDEISRDPAGNELPDAGNITDIFDVGMCDGALSIGKSGVLRYDVGKRTFNLTVRVKVATTPEFFSDILIQVHVDESPKAPVFVDNLGNPISTATVVVDENRPAGAFVTKVTAISRMVDSVQMFGYSIAMGDEEDIFMINSTTGVLTTRRPAFDYEAPLKTPPGINSYTLYIHASDSNQVELQSQLVLKVNVHDLDDAPVVPTQRFDIIEDAVAFGMEYDPERLIFNYNNISAVKGAYDDDVLLNQDDITFSLLDTHSNFEMLPDGMMHVRTALDLGPLVSRPYFTRDNRTVRAVFELTGRATDRKVTTSSTGETSGPLTTLFPAIVYVLVNSSVTNNAIVESIYFRNTPGLTSMETAGGDNIHITGTSFNDISLLQGSNKVNVTFTAAVPGGSTRSYSLIDKCTISSDTMITCPNASPAGYGAQLAVSVTWRAGSEVGVIPTKGGNALVVKYQAPSIVMKPTLNLTVPMSGGYTINGVPTDGSQVITFTVSNTGDLSRFQVSYGPVTGLENSFVITTFTPSLAGGTGLVNVAVPQGTGSRLFIRVTAGDQSSPLANDCMFSYLPPSITSFEPLGTTNFSALGTLQLPSSPQKFLVHGNNFGPTPTTPNAHPIFARFALSAPVNHFLTISCIRQDSSPHKVLECGVPSGVGANVLFHLTVGGLESAYNTNPLAQKFSYAQPVIESVSGVGARDADTAGSQVFVVSGQHFGAASYKNASGTTFYPDIFVRYGPLGGEYTATSCRVLPTAEDRQIECQTRPGAGRNLALQLTMASVRAASPVPLYISYAAPVIISLSKDASQPNAGNSEFKTVGGEYVYIDGSNFGPAITSVLPALPAAPVSVRYVLRLDTPLNALGSSAGVNASTLEREFTPIDCVMTKEHYQLRCVTAPGAGTSLNWFLQVAGQDSTLPALGYRRPEVHSISLLTATGPVPALSLRSSGNQTLLVRGANFGASAGCVANTRNWVVPDRTLPSVCPGDVQVITYGYSGSENIAAEFHVVNDSTLLLRTPVGFGGPLRMIVTVMEQASLASQATFTYESPYITQVSPQTGPAVPDRDTYRIRVTGRNFGTQLSSSEASILLGNPSDGTLGPAISTFSPSSSVNSQGDLVENVNFFLPAGFLQSRAVRIVIHPRGDPNSVLRIVSDPLDIRAPNAAYFNYSAPKINGVSMVTPKLSNAQLTWLLANLPGLTFSNIGSITQLVLIGEHFGASAVPGELVQRSLVLSGAAAGQSVIYESWNNTRIVAYTLAAIGTIEARLQGRNYANTADSVVVSNRFGYSKIAPIISNMEGTTTGIPTVGGPVITLTANHLHITESNLEVLVETFTDAAGSVQTTKATLVDPNNHSRVLRTFADIEDAILNPGRASQGNNDLAVFRVAFIVPPGEGVQRRVFIRRDSSDLSDSTATISYAAPVISTFSVLDAITGIWSAPQPFVATASSYLLVPTLSGRVRFTGSNFGLCPRIFFTTTADRVHLAGAGGALCSAFPDFVAAIPQETYNHTHVTIVMPSGQGIGVDQDTLDGFALVLEASTQGASRLRYRYIDPTITGVTPTGRTTGGQRIQITGYNFGFAASEMRITVGGAPCLDLQYTPAAASALQTVSCILPAGSGRSKAVVFRSISSYSCSQSLSPVQCVNTLANAFSYLPPTVQAMYLGGSGGLASSFSAEDVDYLNEVASFANPSSPYYGAPVSAPLLPNSTIHTSLVPRLPLASYYSVLPSVLERGRLVKPAPYSPANIANASIGVRWPTAGGALFTLEGDNFGFLNVSEATPSTTSCLFALWAGRDRAMVPVCDSVHSFVGENELPRLAILHWSHTRIVFITPPGFGARELTLSVSGQENEHIPVFYSSPVINSLSPSIGSTEGGEPVTALGKNFGRAPMPTKTQAERQQLLLGFPTTLIQMLNGAAPPQAMLHANFARQCFTAHRDADGNVPTAVTQCTQLEGAAFVHAENGIRFPSAPGIGLNRSVSVTVVDYNTSSGTAMQFHSDSAHFSYDRPILHQVLPIPIRVDSTPQTVAVQLSGSNLGIPPSAAETTAYQWTEEELALSVTIGGVACLNPSRYIYLSGSTRAVELRCDLPVMTVGAKNVSYTVAGQSNFNAETSSGAARIACRVGYFGKAGELCAPCPVGGICVGWNGAESTPNSNPPARLLQPNNNTNPWDDIEVLGDAYPRPMPGYFNLNSTDRHTYVLRAQGLMGADETMLSTCPPEIRALNPGRDVCIVGCEPASACVGDNYCAEGYISKPPLFRCSYCAENFYKRGNECVRCPSSPVGLIVGIVVILILGAALAFILNKKRVNVGFIAIGIDWAQVIAIFASSDVEWPGVVRDLFHVLSFFNLNIEIVAPECMIPDVSFKSKWQFVMIFPIALAAFFFFLTVVQGLYTTLIKNQRAKLSDQGSSFVSMILMVFYLLYIYITRMVLDIFNCQPREPDEGKLYMTAGAAEECYVKGGTQQALVPGAIAALFFYVLGYPAIVGYIVYKNRFLMAEDQLLRAKGVGNDRLSNPNAYELRKRFARLYYQFKPEKTFWILAIILRKFLLATTYIMFNRNSSFQLAFALLILFVAYGAQVKYQPYMSRNNFDEVLRSYTARSAAGDRFASNLMVKLKNVESRGRKTAKRTLLSNNGKISASALVQVLGTWLFSYNAVEEILLFSAGLVAVMGIMYASLNDASVSFADARDSVTVVIVVAIIITIIYYFVVVIGELFIVISEDARRMKALEMSKRRLKKSVLSSKGAESVDKEDLSFNNPMSQGSVQKSAAETLKFQQDLGNVDTSFNPLFEKGSTVSRKDMTEVVLSSVQPSSSQWVLFRQGYLDLQKELQELQLKQSEVAMIREKMHDAQLVLESITGKNVDLTNDATSSSASRSAVKSSRKKQAFSQVDINKGTGSVSSQKRLYSGQSFKQLKK